MNEAWTRLSLLIAAGLLPIPLSAAPHPEASYYVDAYARHYQVPRELVNAIIQQESNWNDRAVSIKGACGLMQLMPRTATRLGVSDTFDMKQNISGGVRYLQHLLSQYHGDMRLAVAAYYAGEHRKSASLFAHDDIKVTVFFVIAPVEIPAQIKVQSP